MGAIVKVRNVRRLLLVSILVLSAWAIWTAPAPAAGGGRVQPVPCPTSKTMAKRVSCLVKAVRWQAKNVRHANAELVEVRTATPLLDVQYVCRLGQVIWHVAVSHCKRVIGCESGGNPGLDEYGGSNGAAGAAQYQPATWRGTAFAKAGFSLFDPLPAMFAMLSYAAAHGFNTGGGWSASYHCHGLSGPEA